MLRRKGSAGLRALLASALWTLMAAAGAAGTAPADNAARQGVLYKVTGPKASVYLFGTVHVGTPASLPLPGGVRQALGEAQELVLELDTRVASAFPQAVLAHGSYPSGGRIEQFVAAATMARLTKALHALGVTVASVAHLKPWLIANLLMGMELQRGGLERGQGVESVLLDHAQAHGTVVTELESADYQLALFDTLSAAQSEHYLLETLAALDDGSALRKAHAAIDAWASGQPLALDALMAEAVEGDSVVSTFTRDVLLGKRNPDMAAHIARLMDSGRTAFVGVGLLHLLGADGLPRLLSRRGFLVERL